MKLPDIGRPLGSSRISRGSSPPPSPAEDPVPPLPQSPLPAVPRLRLAGGCGLRGRGGMIGWDHCLQRPSVHRGMQPFASVTFAWFRQPAMAFHLPEGSGKLPEGNDGNPACLLQLPSRGKSGCRTAWEGGSAVTAREEADGWKRRLAKSILAKLTNASVCATFLPESFIAFPQPPRDPVSGSFSNCRTVLTRILILEDSMPAPRRLQVHLPWHGHRRIDQLRWIEAP